MTVIASKVATFAAGVSRVDQTWDRYVTIEGIGDRMGATRWCTRVPKHAEARNVVKIPAPLIYGTFDDVDTAGGVMTDVMGNYDINLQNTPTTGVTGNVGEMYLLDDASNEFVSTGTADIVEESATYSYMIDCTPDAQNPATGMVALGMGINGGGTWDGQWLQFGSSGGDDVIYVVIEGGSSGQERTFGTSFDFVAGVRYICIVTFDGFNVKLWINGALVIEDDVGSFNGPTYETTNYFECGRYRAGASRYWSGHIDEAAWWHNDVLTDAQAVALYHVIRGGYRVWTAAYKPYVIDLPSPMSERVDPEGGMTEAGELSVDMLDSADELTAALKIDADPVNTVSTAVGASDTSIAVDSGPAFSIGDFIYIGNECMHVTNIVSNALTIVRAQLDTVARPHAFGSPVYTALPYLHGRRMRYYEIPHDAVGESAQLEWEQYQLDGIELSEDGNSFTLLGLTGVGNTSQLVKRRPQDQFVARTVFADEHFSAEFFGPRTATADGEIWTGERMTFEMEGEIFRASMPFFGFTSSNILLPTDRALLGSRIHSPEPGDTGSQVFIANKDESGAVFRYSPGTNTPGYVSGSESSSRGSGTWVKSDHFVPILLCLLTSSADSNDGLELTNFTAGEGNFSSLPIGVGVGLPADRIDWTSFHNAWAATPGWRFPGFVVRESESFGELVSREILRVIGAYLSTQNGKISLVLPTLPPAGLSIPEIGSTNIRYRKAGARSALPEISARMVSSRLSGTVIFSVKTPGGADVKIVVDDQRFHGRYGQAADFGKSKRAIEIDAPSVFADGGLANAFLETVGNRIIWENSRPRWDVSATTLYDPDLYDKRPGDFVTIAVSEFPQLEDGTRGWLTGTVPARINSIAPEHVEGQGSSLRFDLTAFGSGTRIGRVGPAAMISSVATNTATVVANRHTQADAPTTWPVTDAAGFAVDDECVLRNLDGSDAGGATKQTVTVIAGNDITFDGNFGGNLAANLVIKYANYDSSAAQQISTRVYVADRAARTIDASSAKPWAWTIEGAQ